ncbi:MAG TPA: hypothetical protein VIH62_14050 [Xanthobacteraceae bacterium]
MPLLLVTWLSAVPAAAEGITEVWQGAHWGESSAALFAHFAGSATALPRPLDFGDSYADVVLRNVPVGGFPLIAYFQMDKTTHKLKRIQLERPRHGVTPAAFRGVLAALEGAYGTPDAMCGTGAGPASGYQVGAERIWRRAGIVIRAIFRSTTIEAFEGCPFGDLTAGPCGLTAQLLVRISPPGEDGENCPAPPATTHAGARR